MSLLSRNNTMNNTRQPNDIQRRFRRFCCCLRTNQIDYRVFNDPSSFHIDLAIQALSVRRSTPWIIADFGSSYGQNSIQMMKIILECLRQRHKLYQIPLIIHLDLPTNNWTKFFQALTTEKSLHSFALGRSFYEQCLPADSLSIGFSHASLHYLSRRPCSIVHHCYIHFAQACEREQFRQQAKCDLQIFIEHRARELRSGGVLILSIPSVNEQDEMGFHRYFHLIYQCAQIFFSDDQLEQFTLPFYLRSASECIDMELFKRCSLKLIHTQFVRLKPWIFHQYRNKEITLEQLARSLVILMQSAVDTTLKQTLEIHQRSPEDIQRISTEFWSLFEQRLQSDIAHDPLNTYTTYLILKKK